MAFEGPLPKDWSNFSITKMFFPIKECGHGKRFWQQQVEWILEENEGEGSSERRKIQIVQARNKQVMDEGSNGRYREEEVTGVQQQDMKTWM